jgi:predicted O-methyltransferase YrrM
MNDLLREIYRTGVVYDSAGRPSRAFPSGIKYGIGMTLYDLAMATRAERSLEIGMAFGLSSLFLCQAHRDKGSGVHTAIDPKEETTWKSIGLLNVERAGLGEFLEFHSGPSHEALPQLVASGKKFDLIFIDGMHLFDYAMVDFFFADLLLKEQGYLVLDDIWLPSIMKVLSFALRNRHYTSADQRLWDRKSTWRRALDFLLGLTRDASLRQRAKAVARSYLDNLLDVHFLLLTTRCAVHAGLDCWVLQKASADDRAWNQHWAF